MTEHRRQEHVDLYELLEVSPRASHDVIQAAYRALARIHHPDLNPQSDAGARIRLLNDAYAVLSDPLRRARYDLERTRARRHEWVVNQQKAVVVGAVPLRQGGQGRPQASPPSARVGRAIDDRLSVRNSQIVLGLILVTTVLVIAFVLVWATTDSVVETAPAYRAPALEFTGR